MRRTERVISTLGRLPRLADPPDRDALRRHVEPWSSVGLVAMAASILLATVIAEFVPGFWS